MEVFDMVDQRKTQKIENSGEVKNNVENDHKRNIDFLRKSAEEKGRTEVRQSHSSSHSEGVTDHPHVDQFTQSFMDKFNLNALAERKLQKEIDDIIKETYKGKEVFICKIGGKSVVADNKEEFQRQAKDKGLIEGLNIVHDQELNLINNKCFDHKGREILGQEITLEDRKNILKTEQEAIIKRINEYEYQLFGKKVASKIYGCEIGDEFHIARSELELGRIISQHTGKEVKILSLSEIEEKQRMKVESLKKKVSEDAKKVLGEAYDVICKFRDKISKYDREKIKRDLQANILKKEIVDEMINYFEKGESISRNLNDNMCCEVKDGKLEFFEKLKDDSKRVFYTVEKLSLQQASTELENIKKEHEIDNFEGIISKHYDEKVYNKDDSPEVKYEKMKKWLENTTNNIIKFEKELYNREDVKKLPTGDVLYPYRVVIKEGNGSEQSEVRYYESQEEAEKELGVNGMKVGEDPRKPDGEKSLGNRKIESVTYLGLDQRLKELQPYAIKARLEKLGRPSIDGDALSNSNDISLYRCDHEGKVYVATSPEALVECLKKGRPNEGRISLPAEQVSVLKELKDLDDTIKALDGEIGSLDDRKQELAKKIFGSEGKEAFSLRISTESGATDSEFKVLGEGAVEYHDENGRIIGCYRDVDSFKREHKIVKNNENGEWVEDNEGLEEKIKKGEKFACIRKNADRSEVPFICERPDLYGEVADREKCLEKLREKVKGLYKDVTGVEIKSDPGSNSEAQSLQLYAHEFGGNVYITTEPKLEAADLRGVRAQRRRHVKQEDIDALKPSKEAEQAKKVKVEPIGLDEAYRRLSDEKQKLEDKRNNAEKQNNQGRQEIKEIQELYVDIFNKRVDSKHACGYMLRIIDKEADNRELRKVFEMGEKDTEKFLTLDQIDNLTKGRTSFREFYNTAINTVEENRPGKLDVPDQKPELERLTLEETKKNLEEMRRNIDNDIKEIFATDKGEDEKFYVYRVADVGGQLAGIEEGSIIVLDGKKGEVDDKELKNKFNANNEVEGGEEIKNIRIDEKIKYIGKEGNKGYIELERISLKAALDQERKNVEAFVNANRRLGDLSISGGEDVTSWKSIRYYEIEDDGQTRYEAAKNPKHMAERLGEKYKISHVGGKDVTSSNAMEVLTEAIKAVTGGQNDSLHIGCDGGKSFSIKRAEKEIIVEFLNKEIKNVETEIKGMIKRYNEAFRDNIFFNRYDRPKKISLADNDYKNWTNVYAAWEKDEFSGEKKLILTSNESKCGKDILSIKDAKQELEKIVEQEEVPGEINKLIVKKLEVRIRQGLGIGQEDWDAQKGEQNDQEKKKNGQDRIKYYFPPPKYVFARKDIKTGQETYYFGNSYRRAAKSLGVSVNHLRKEVAKKDGKIQLVPLDSKALKFLKDCEKQDTLEIRSLGDIYQFKDKNGKWYITNDGRFHEHACNAGLNMTLERSVTPFNTGWSASGDSKKKKSWFSLWGGDTDSDEDSSPPPPPSRDSWADQPGMSYDNGILPSVLNAPVNFNTGGRGQGWG
jgi:hypothetical protein